MIFGAFAHWLTEPSALSHRVNVKLIQPMGPSLGYDRLSEFVDATVVKQSLPFYWEIETVLRHTQIGDRAWIGARAILLPGIRISYGAVVGAGLVASKNVPDREVHVGNPAHKIGD
jgi:hypothetical protein